MRILYNAPDEKIGNRSWSDYEWTKHALQRIAESGRKLITVFNSFEIAVEVPKSDWHLVKDFVRHGGVRGMKSIVLYDQSQATSFIIQGKTVVTVVFNAKISKTVAKGYQIINGKIVPI